MKKLIRNKIVERLELSEWEVITDHAQLNHLYALKVQEELNEIISARFQDGLEFADLIEVAYAFAKANGFTAAEIDSLRSQKEFSRGAFSDIALTNLDPNNPSNQIYT